MFRRTTSAFPPVASCLVVALVATSAVSPVFGQADRRAVFVSNNGNLEGSVTAFTIGPGGSLTLVNRIVTGSRAAINDPCRGCNAYEIALTPSGRYLATAHPAGPEDGLTVFDVAANATITQIIQITMTPTIDGPLDLVWLDEEYLAVAATEPSPDRILIFRFNPAVPSLIQVNSYNAGSSSAYLLKHPGGAYLYANDSTNRVVLAYSIGAGGTLTLIDSEPTGAPFPLELAITPAGNRMYAAGGISDSGNKVVGLNVAGDGTLSLIPGSPFVSAGASPSNVFATRDGKFLFVGHGTDATVRSMGIDAFNGSLLSTGFMFDVGLQGTLGDVATAPGLMFVTDNSTATDGLMGIYSFTINADGSFTQNGPIVSTGGIAPRSIAVWIPVLKGDMNCDGVVDLVDEPLFVLAQIDPDAYAAAEPFCSITRADMNMDMLINGDDMQLFVNALLGP